jgi:hypothetical protein
MRRGLALLALVTVLVPSVVLVSSAVSRPVERAHAQAAYGPFSFLAFFFGFSFPLVPPAPAAAPPPAASPPSGQNGPAIASNSVTLSASTGSSATVTADSITVTVPNLGSGVQVTVTVYASGKVSVIVTPATAADANNIQICKGSSCQTVGFTNGEADAWF